VLRSELLERSSSWAFAPGRIVSAPQYMEPTEFEGAGIDAAVCEMSAHD
jgi:hypothetical protein